MSHSLPPSSSGPRPTGSRGGVRRGRPRREKVPASRDALVSVYTLVSAMNRASALPEVYDAALDALTAGLGAERASIMIFDPDGVLRFKAWRGLSDGYRAAVEGHSPWTADAADARPILVPDVAADPALAPLCPAILAEGIRALAFIPLCFGRQLLGKFMIYHAAPHAFDPEEVQVAEIIAGHVASAVVRRRDEEALRQSEERLRLLAETVPSMVWAAGPDGHVSYANERLLRFTGLTADDLARGFPWQAVHPEDVGRCISALAAARAAAAELECENRCRRHDGEYRWVLTRAVPVKSAAGRVTAWFGSTTDIHERKQAEQALRRERELLQTIFDRIPVMITLYDPATRVLGVNSEFERLLGWSARDAAGHALMEACYPDPEYRHAVQAFMDSCADRWMDLRMRTRDGREVETSWANIRLSDDTRVGIGIDITERKQTEERLREADRRKDDFLATLSHELRNPLAPIRNAVELISRSPDDRAATERARAVLERQLRQLVRLVDDLLDVSRITRGKMELRREPVEVHAAVASAIETAQPLVESAGLELVLAPAPGPVHVSGDFVRLAQVFANILNNAARYTDRGGRIDIAVEAADGGAVVRVRDTGIGIHPAALDRIFDPFEQVGSDSADTRSRGGLGIGLSLVRGLVELHGGRVEARSDGPGQGSEFVVHLPLLDGEEARPAPEGRSVERDAAQGRRVLVADDNPDSAETLAMVLRARGHEVHVVADGEAAVEAVKALAPEVALLDIGMPRLTGYEAAERIRREPWGRRTFLVALTGWGQEQDQHRAHAAGFDVHLTKPVDLDTLAALVSRAPAA